MQVCGTFVEHRAHVQRVLICRRHRPHDRASDAARQMDRRDDRRADAEVRAGCLLLQLGRDAHLLPAAGSRRDRSSRLCGTAGDREDGVLECEVALQPVFARVAGEFEQYRHGRSIADGHGQRAAYVSTGRDHGQADGIAARRNLGAPLSTRSSAELAGTALIYMYPPVDGGITAVLLELGEERVRSGVWNLSIFPTDPITRMRRTGLATHVSVYAPVPVAEKPIGAVVRMHERVEGAYPSRYSISGKRARAAELGSVHRQLRLHGSVCDVLPSVIG